MDYPFQRACVQPPPSLRKNRRKGVCGEGGDCTQASLRQIIHFSSSVKTTNNKISLSSVFNDSEKLYWTTVCRCLVRRPHYSTQLMRFGSRGPSEFATEMPWLRGKTPYRNRHGNVYRSVGEKQGLVVYRHRVLQTVTSLRVVSLLFRRHDLLKIANINPQHEATLSLWKKLSPWESGRNGALV